MSFRFHVSQMSTHHHTMPLKKRNTHFSNSNRMQYPSLIIIKDSTCFFLLVKSCYSSRDIMGFVPHI